MDSVIHEDLTTVESISPFLKACVGKGKEIPPGNILQVQQVTNVSFPTYDRQGYEPDKHILKITVTDGKSQGYALVADSCPGITTNTPWGTKIMTTQPIPVHGSLFILTRNNCEVLGGKVPKLFEKWEVQKKMTIKHEWGYSGTALEGEGPPPWKPFGFRPSIDVSVIRKMKTTDVATTKDKKDGQAGEGEKTQFDLQRDEAISELQSATTNKLFQKPKKRLLDKEITDIMEEGFTQEVAEYAMGRFKNVQKALKFLKDSKRREEGLPEPPKPTVERKPRKKGKGWDRDDDEDEQFVPREYQRPTTSVSLFGFLEGHVKVEDKDKPSDKDSRPDREFEDDMGRLNMEDSRYDSNYGGYGGRGDRGGRGRGRGRGRGDRGGRGGRGGYRGGRDHDDGGGGDSFQQRRGGYRGGSSYGSDYRQQEYQKPKEYQAPPQYSAEAFPDLLDTREPEPRQNSNNNWQSERHEKQEHSRYNWEQRGTPHETNHSARGGGRYNNPYPTSQYHHQQQRQQGYQEEWNPNPAQSQGYPRYSEGGYGRSNDGGYPRGNDGGYSRGNDGGGYHRGNDGGGYPRGNDGGYSRGNDGGGYSRGNDGGYPRNNDGGYSRGGGNDGGGGGRSRGRGGYRSDRGGSSLSNFFNNRSSNMY